MLLAVLHTCSMGVGMARPKEPQAMGDVIKAMLPDFERIKDRLGNRKEEFLASGGRCTVCFDTGIVPATLKNTGPMICEEPHCQRGIERRQSEQMRHAALLQRTSGALRYDLDPRSHPNQPLVDHVMGWVDTSWLSALARRDKYATGGDDPFLLLYGSPGVGKSQIAAAALRRTITRGARTAKFVSMVRLLDQLRVGSDSEAQRKGHETLEAAITADAVVLDDIGRDNKTDWVERILFQIIDERYTRRAWTIVTTNRDPASADRNAVDSLDTWVGEAVFGRIIERSEIVNCGGAGKNLRL